MKYLADNTDAQLGGILAYVRDNKSQRVIETELLDGSFTVQTIGTSSMRLEIEHYCSLAVRRSLETKRDAAEPIKIYWKDKVYTGLISGAVNHETWSRNKTDLAEKLTFTVLVTAEADQ